MMVTSIVLDLPVTGSSLLGNLLEKAFQPVPGDVHSPDQDAFFRFECCHARAKSFVFRPQSSAEIHGLANSEFKRGKFDVHSGTIEGKILLSQGVRHYFQCRFAVSHRPGIPNPLTGCTRKFARPPRQRRAGAGTFRGGISAMFREMRSSLADSPDFSSIRRVLVAKLRHHGDVLLASPVFSALKAHAPHLEIDALVYADTREMLERHPAIANVHAVGRDWRGLSAVTRLRREVELLSGLRRREFDLLIHLTEHPRGAWLARFLGCRYAVAPNYGNRSRFWKNSFSHRFALPLNAYRHMVEWNLDSLRRLGIHPPPEARRLTLVPGAAADADALALLAEAGMPADGFIHLHPASRWSFKCWPARQTAQLIDRLHAAGHKIVVTASPADEERDFVREILSLCAVRPADLSGRLSMSSLASLTGRARLFIGVDSAPMHMAAAMGTPVVAVFGPSGDREWGPWMVPHRVVSSSSHPCRPCGRDGCGGGKVSDCLEVLTVAEVMSAVDALIAA